MRRAIDVFTETITGGQIVLFSQYTVNLQSRLHSGHSVYNTFMPDKIVTYDSFLLELWSHRLRTT